MSIFLQLNAASKLSIDVDDQTPASFLYDYIVNSFNQIKDGDFQLVSKRGGLLLNKTSLVQRGDTFIVCPRVLGGKGGFGSLLRAFGKQITMSTNKEACRDLTGRRLRSVNQEKKLKEFVSKQAELAEKREAEKKAKAERRRAKRDKAENPHHVFVDPNYEQQKDKIQQDLDEALGKALESKRNKRKHSETEHESPQPSTSKQAELSDSKLPEASIDRKHHHHAEEKKGTAVIVKKTTNTKFKGWLGAEDLDVSSSSDEEEANEPVKKSKKV